jgi:uncharacterized membrane protein (DUF485 family)
MVVVMVVVVRVTMMVAGYVYAYVYVMYASDMYKRGRNQMQGCVWLVPA